MESSAGRWTPEHREPFAVAYPRLWQELRRLEWSAYVDGTSLDRSAIDRRIYAAASGADPPVDDADARLVDQLRQRALVDHHLDVARMRDRLDDPRTSGPMTGPAAEWARELARRMEPDLVELIILRNQLAQASGARSYGHLALASEALDLDTVMASMTRLRDACVEGARALAVDTGSNVDTWFEGLDRVAGPATADAPGIAGDLAARLGLDDVFHQIQLVVADGALPGWTAACSIPDDIRLVVRHTRSLRDLGIVFHELGHALAYASTRSVGIRAIPGDTQDEALAMVLEHIGPRLVLGAHDRARLERIAVAETARLATSALFEASIQADPARARQQFRTMYEPFVAVPDPVVWALDSFRSIDPFRVHGYVLGFALARRLADRLVARLGDDHRAWGRWLRGVLWAPGRRDSFDDLLALVAEDERHSPL